MQKPCNAPNQGFKFSIKLLSSKNFTPSSARKDEAYDPTYNAVLTYDIL